MIGIVQIFSDVVLYLENSNIDDIIFNEMIIVVYAWECIV